MTRRPLLLAAVLLALVLTAGCNDSSTGAGTQTAADASPTSSAMPQMSMGGSASPQTGAALDRSFIAAMVPHHQTASDMAKVEVAKGKNAKVKAIAQRIIDAQGKEIAQLTSIATARFSFTPDRMMGPMTEPMMRMPISMNMSAMATALGQQANVDRAFLLMMIPHHSAAIVMADEEGQRGSDPELVAMAKKVVTDQAKEIGEMQALLDAGV